MTVVDYSTERFIFYLGDSPATLRNIKDWDDTDPPFNITDLQDKNTPRQYLGGLNGVHSRTNNGATVTINLAPGSSDSNFVSSLYNAGGKGLYGTHVQQGTLEASQLSDGIITRNPDGGRGGPGFTGDSWTITFLKSTQIRGGDSAG